MKKILFQNTKTVKKRHLEVSGGTYQLESGWRWRQRSLKHVSAKRLEIMKLWVLNYHYLCNLKNRSVLFTENTSMSLDLPKFLKFSVMSLFLFQCYVLFIYIEENFPIFNQGNYKFLMYPGDKSTFMLIVAHKFLNSKACFCTNSS